jgi:hypothetical protein
LINIHTAETREHKEIVNPKPNWEMNNESRVERWSSPSNSRYGKETWQSLPTVWDLIEDYAKAEARSEEVFNGQMD